MALRLTAIEIIAEVLEITPAKVSKAFWLDEARNPQEAQILEMRDLLYETWDLF